MRYLLAIALLLTGLTSLKAATFLERFNALEQDLQSVQDELQNLKDRKGGGSSDASTTPKSSSESVKVLMEAIRQLNIQQKNLDQKIKNLQNQPKSVTSSSKDAASLVEDEDDDDEIQEQLDELNKAITQVRKFTNGNHLKLNVDFRTAVDNINYTLANGTQKGNDAVLSNRLWINMKYKATQNFSFTGQLAYNKTFGAREGTGTASGTYDNFDWITNETANDGILRVKKAYFFYANETFLGTKVPWTFSIGRRPSTNGHLINLRDDDKASSPLAHAINVEFDGMSSKFDFANKTGIPGLYLKFCLGRGLTNATASLDATPYATDDTAPKDIDLVGVIASLYNNGQYALTTQTYTAKNLIDLNQTTAGASFESVGDLSSFTANFTIEGIGEDSEPFLSDHFGKFLDETIFFISYSASYSEPYANGSMLGSPKPQVGRSYWVGLQMPSVSEKGRWGLEYNHGDQYWRSITYAEDTFIGSKMAVRGDAYEIYFTEPFANKSMSWQLRYTYIDYKYSGSNGFFGSTTGNSTLITDGSPYVDTASDLRFYLRYRY